MLLLCIIISNLRTFVREIRAKAVNKILKSKHFSNHCMGDWIGCQRQFNIRRSGTIAKPARSGSSLRDATISFNPSVFVRASCVYVHLCVIVV